MEEEKVENLTEEVNYKDKYLRALADLDNYRKNAELRIANIEKYKNEQILLDLIDILDIIEYGEKAENVSIEDKYKVLVQQLEKFVEIHDVKPIEDCEIFNGDYHNAISSVNIEDKEDNAIVETWKKGYLYKDKVLRYAQVVVNKK